MKTTRRGLLKSIGSIFLFQYPIKRVIQSRPEEPDNEKTPRYYCKITGPIWYLKSEQKLKEGLARMTARDWERLRKDASDPGNQTLKTLALFVAPISPSGYISGVELVRYIESVARKIS